MKVAIAGYGTEGISAAQYYQAQGAQITVFDERPLTDNLLPQSIHAVTGPEALRNIGPEYDLIVRSPGINPRKIPAGNNVTSVTKEFFRRCPAPIIGVTGSKGKGTTSSLIYEILKAAGKQVHLAGNIGVPALDILANVTAEDIVVLELSSFQLWDLECSPHIAVVLMIEPDHLEVHDSLDDYVSAKANIARHQTGQDICIHHPTNQFAIRIAAQSLGTKIAYNIRGEGSVYVENNMFYMNNKPICRLDCLQIPGKHNWENACAAIMAALNFTANHDAIAQGLRNFKGLPHRLKFVREVGGTAFYDDSIATTPGSAIAALAAFEEPKVIILGGSDKGADYSGLADHCARTASLRAAVCIGQMGPNIYDLLKQRNVPAILSASKSMSEIVGEAAKLAQRGDKVILSPACASFDMFTSYSDRGEKFIAAVKSL